MKTTRLICLIAILMAALLPARRAPAQDTKLFADNCAYCHGADGKGGRGPAIATMPHTIALSDADLLGILQHGQGSMPSFPDLGEQNLRAIVRYIRVLQKPSTSAASAALPGDPAAGKALFYGTARCSNCHMVAGQGGFMGPDLTAYAQNHGAEEIGQTVLHPEAHLPPSSHVVEVVTRSGEKISGLVRNEDNMGLTLQTKDGRYYFLTRSECASVTDTNLPLMPQDYGTRLTPKNIDDIESFLLQSAKNAPAEAPQGRRRRNNN